MRKPPIPPEFFSRRMSDGCQLRGRLWRSPEPQRGCGVVYLHGIQSHGGWFEWSAGLLAASGLSVLVPDRRGSGLNADQRGDTPNRARWLMDLDELSDWFATEQSVTSLSVVGVSWGGKLATAWALKRPQLVSRLLLIAPGLFPAVDIGLSGRLRVAACLGVCPTTTLPIPLDDPALFTDNPAGRNFIADDPLKLTRATARFLYQSSRLDHTLIGTAPGALAAPATLILAGCDRIIRNGPTETWLRRIARHPVSLHAVPNAAHTLEFEADGTPFENILSEWAGD